MRLLHVISSIDPKGGGPIEGVRQLRLPLLQAGVQVQVCSNDAPDADYVRQSELDVIALGPTKMHYGYNPRMVAWLRAHRADYDAVIVEGLWQFHSIAVWLALRGGPTPYFVYSHGMLDPWFKQRYPLKHLKKMLYWQLGEYWVLRGARSVLFTCEEERRLARESFSPYTCREAITSYGTAQPPQDAMPLRAAFHDAFPQTKGRRNLLFFGRIHEKKGCDLLIESFANVAARDSTLQLVMAGPASPELLATLKRMATWRGIGDRVVWTGMLSGDLKWGAFHAAEVFCLPSHQENFGVAVAEALGCGLPVLISDKVNIWREIVGDGAGYASADTAAEFTLMLMRWLDEDQIQHDRMREAAAECFARRFQSRQVAERLLGVIRASLDEGRGGHDGGREVGDSTRTRPA